MSEELTQAIDAARLAVKVALALASKADVRGLVTSEILEAMAEALQRGAQ